MKGFIITALLLVSLTATAEELENKPGLRQQLRVEFIKKTQFYIWESGGYSTTRNDWLPYQGIMSISKHDFYSITGYNDLAQQVLSREKTNKKLRKKGSSLMIWGTGIMLSSPILPLPFLLIEESTPVIYNVTGGVLAIIGLITMLRGVSHLGDINTNPLIPANIAQDIANEYNQGLSNDR